jgi:hypothetical protein
MFDAGLPDEFVGKYHGICSCEIKLEEFKFPCDLL